jgi:hypothetical protein
MGLEALDDTLDGGFEEEVVAVINTQVHNLDARRRLEDKMEELRLRREMREFDFDF